MARERDMARHPHPVRIETRPGRSACARSLAENIITNRGKDMSAVIKLAEVLSQTSINSLKCAPLATCDPTLLVFGRD